MREVCIVPIAFVSDHVETLGEIDHEARYLAGQLGFTQFEMSAGLNDSPKFISALSELVLEALAGTMESRIAVQESGKHFAAAGMAAD